jgi:oligopeptide transport system permease protein
MNKFELANVKNKDNEKFAKNISAFSIFMQNKLVVPVIIILFILIFLSFFGPYFGAYGAQSDLQHPTSLSKQPMYTDENGKLFIFGTDALGRDYWVRVWEGTRLSIIIAITATIIELVIGVTIGLFSGYYQGKFDATTQFLTLILINVPTIIFLVIFSAIFGRGQLVIISVLAFTGWVTMSRIVRANTMKIKNSDFVNASKTFGAKDKHILFSHVLPNLLGIILMVTAASIPTVIFAESILSSLGYGVQIPIASLGTIIFDSKEQIGSARYEYLFIIPSVVISLLVLSFTIIANSLRDAFDPNQRRK